MDSTFIDKFRHALNADVAQRLLIKYFVSKGYDNFDRLLYPPIIQDMAQMIPEMADKIEVVPFCEIIDPLSDTATLGWNLFVMGIQRQFLGETHHVGLASLALQLQQGQVLSENMLATRQTTPRRIVKFVIDVITKHKAGYINLTPRVMPLALHGRGSYNPGGQMFARSSYGT
jgi:hypothetical protein